MTAAMFFHALRTALVLAASIGTASYILTWAKVSDGLRQRLQQAAHRDRARQECAAAKFWAWASDLFRCPFCVSVWLSLFATAIYRPLLVREFLPVDFLVTALAVSCTSMGAVFVIGKALGRYTPPAPLMMNPLAASAQSLASNGSGNGSEQHGRVSASVSPQ